MFLRQKVVALTEIASGIREWIADAPPDDPDAVALLRFCDTLDQVAVELQHPIALELRTGTPANSLGTTGGTAQ